jgi:hypothetical protein
VEDHNNFLDATKKKVASKINIFIQFASFSILLKLTFVTRGGNRLVGPDFVRPKPGLLKKLLD